MVDAGAGLVILTDVHGSSPFRACLTMLDGTRPVEIVCGINLPMLIKWLQSIVAANVQSRSRRSSKKSANDRSASAPSWRARSGSRGKSVTKRCRAPNGMCR